MINFYFFEGQLRSYLLQFCNIFTGLKVQTGKGECDVPEYISVPITIGSRDRVVAALQAGNTQNRPFVLPIMAANITGIGLPTSRKGTGVVDNRTFLPAGGIYPDDLRVVQRVMPIPYSMQIDLTLYASNTLQSHQILEQLLMLFDPTLQIQTSDAAFDWTKISSVELVGISNEENYPSGMDRRAIAWTLQFDLPIYISAPVDIRDELVRKIIIQIGDLSGFNVNEFDQNGQLVPFTATYATAIINTAAIQNINPPVIAPETVNQHGTISVVDLGRWTPSTGLNFSFQWFNGTAALVEGDKATGTQTPILTLTGDFADGEQFTCAVTTSDGTHSATVHSNVSSMLNTV